MPAPTELPERGEDAEADFVRAWSNSDDTTGLMEMVGAAIEARRPKLAADLAYLLDDHIEVPPGSPIDRARKAARLLVLSKYPADEASWADIDDAWRQARKRMVSRAKRRMRDRINDPAGRNPRRRRR